MSSSPLLSDSASGVRPAGAFLLLGAVFLLLALWLGRLVFADDAPIRQRVESDPGPEYAIVDRNERPLADFVQRLDLVCSPNALWQAHTPEILAPKLASVLGGDYTAAELLERTMPDAEDDVVKCTVALDARQASAVQRWIETGVVDPTDTPARVEGIAVVARPEGGWVIWWRPSVVLSERVRSAHFTKDNKNPLRWTRRIADGLARAIKGDAAAGDASSEDEIEAQREEIWRMLMPHTYTVAIRGFDAAVAPKLFQLLSDQGVLHVQMHIARDRDRVYPMGAQRVLGAWGYVDQKSARDLALHEAGLDREPPIRESGRPAFTLAQLDAAKRRAEEILAEVHPISGLELAAARELQRSDWGELQRVPASYTFERHSPVRRKEPRVVPRSYYIDSNEASETPRVVTTIDAYLQKRVGEELDVLMERNRPALAMAIVLDVATGDVLAVDAREAYRFGAFAPLKHQFTPGSTFKVIVMAIALDDGKVEPDDVFDVGHGEYRLPGRVIREADNPGKQGRVTASEILAHSLNGGMVQIGPRVEASVLRDYLVRLGYGQAPHASLGPEASGQLPALPWKPSWTHASVSFGHELMVSTWQHAAGLATVLRGGEFRPLRVVEAVEQDGLRYLLPRTAPVRVFRRETSDRIRAMMQLGAREGTGEPVAGPNVLHGVEVGTKTGTAQKVPGEVCVHVDLEHQARHWAERSSCSSACRKALVDAKRDHLHCYTSSMCAFGRLPGTEREVMVLVIADEPRKGKYGSRVAGPTAISILKEALGLTRLGQAPLQAVLPGFAPSPLMSMELSERPWAEAVH
ncbi:MAG: hypothetical protein HZA52_21195 [Planctomycetes bacterium]|nr:hypothetical protein [Planctomycetota bacterium]